MEVGELQFKVLVDPTAPGVVKDAITFETGSTLAETREPHVYEHHGEEFSPGEPGALARFYEDLIIGTPFPLTFATREIKDIDTILAITLFLHRELAIHPATPGIVAMVDLIHRRGPAFFGHVDQDLARFLWGLRGYFPKGLSRQEVGERIGTASQWIRDYVLSGDLPNIGPRTTQPRVLDVGTNGFVIAEVKKPSIEAWGDLYRLGFLRGFLIGPADGDFRHVIASRKSDHVEFNLQQAAIHMNELERVSGGDASWRVEGNFLFGPSDGSVVSVQYMLGVFLRV